MRRLAGMLGASIEAVRRSPGKRSSPVRALVMVWAVVAVAGIACHGHHDDTPDPTLADVVYVPPTTDEALLRLLDLPPSNPPAQRLAIGSPSGVAALSKDTPVPLTFYGQTSAAASPRRHAPPVSGRSGVRPAWLDELLQLVGPIRAAHAHGEPFNGNGYYLVITDATGAARMRVFTSQSGYVPTLAAWSALAQAPQPLALTITWGIFEQNEVTSDGGPFVGGSVLFYVE